jgi:hypothetical protein
MVKRVLRVIVWFFVISISIVIAAISLIWIIEHPLDRYRYHGANHQATLYDEHLANPCTSSSGRCRQINRYYITSDPIETVTTHYQNQGIVFERHAWDTTDGFIGIYARRSWRMYHPEIIGLTAPYSSLCHVYPDKQCIGIALLDRDQQGLENASIVVGLLDFFWGTEQVETTRHLRELLSERSEGTLIIYSHWVADLNYEVEALFHSKYIRIPRVFSIPR